jgi:hypothetical protein
MNSYVQTILSLLKEKRGIAATAVAAEGADGRHYVQVVGVPGFPVFAVKPSGAYELPFEHSYTNAGMKKMGLTILDGRSEGLNAVLFADKLAARPRNRHDLCLGYGYDRSAIELVRQMATEAVPEKSQVIWREPSDGGGHLATNASRVDESRPGGRSVGSRCISSQVSVTDAAPPRANTCVAAHKLCSYFERDGQQRALEAYAKFAFAPAMGWGIQDKMELYEASRRAFYQALPEGEALSAFSKIYDDLYRPAPAGGWGVGRNSAGPCWPAAKTFETIKTEFPLFSWAGPVTLLNAHTLGDWATLLSSLEKMRELKPVAGYPVMAVSKFLHFYNPELFPIYDNLAIKDGVFKCFRNDFREFCYASGLQYESPGNTVTCFWKYIRWASSLLASAHSGFMEAFVDWLRRQPGAELQRRGVDASTLYATAFEFVAIGAWCMETEDIAASA